MPVLTVKGMPANVADKLYTLLNDLQRAAASVLMLRPGEVSVFFPQDLLSIGLGEELICIVDGLFEKPDRTRDVRQKLAGSILFELHIFAQKNLPQCGKIEVMIARFNQSIDGFAVWGV